MPELLSRMRVSTHLLMQNTDQDLVDDVSCLLHNRLLLMLSVSWSAIGGKHTHPPTDREWQRRPVSISTSAEPLIRPPCRLTLSLANTLKS